MTTFRLLLMFCFLASIPCATCLAAEQAPSPLALESPDGQLSMTFRLDAQGRPAFDLAQRDRSLVAARLGLEFASSGPLLENFKVVASRRADRDETYAIPVGKTSQARDQHRELVVSLQENAPPHRKLDITFRCYNDGLAFRYTIPEQEPIAKFVLTDEPTRLSFVGNPTARALPLNSYTTSYEKYYDTLPVSQLPPNKLFGLPLLLEYAADGGQQVWLAVTEAGLKDYAGMYLAGVDGEPGTLTARLSPLPGRSDGAKVRGTTPFETPWRVLIVADDPGRLIESNLVFHLNDPPAISDTSWIKPGATTFPWWNGYVLEGMDFEPGVNTATMKHYIDFCAEHGIPYHSLDGLDIAWYGGPIHPKGPTDVTTAAPSIDMPEVLRHAQEKNVRLRLWMHWKVLQPQIDEAFREYEKWGIEGVMVDFMDRDDQEMVRFYHEMAEKAARHRLTLTLHGAYKPTGMERTWPNVLTYEAALNQEYNKWQPPGVRGTPPRHNLDIAFIRMLAGPLDYHQGGMRNVLPENYQWRDKAPPVQGTRGHQLAMYVVYQNHLPMLADYPSAYRGQPGFDFLVDVPANWDETRVLHAEIDQCLVVARRRGPDWYLGGMTAGEDRQLELKLDVLAAGPRTADLYFDVAGDPRSVERVTKRLNAGDTLPVFMPRDGGFAGKLSKPGD
jgi:alpha-glucosidase